MPELSRFYGIVVSVFFKDHPPPHVHVKEGHDMLVLNIRTGDVIEGEISKRGTSCAKRWLELHREELLQAWDVAVVGGTPERIPPLARKGGAARDAIPSDKPRRRRHGYGKKPSSRILMVEWIQANEVRIFFAYFLE